MSIDKQSAGRYNGSPNKTQNRELPSPSGFIKTKGGQREEAMSTGWVGSVHLRFDTVCLEDRLTVLFFFFFLKFFCPRFSFFFFFI